MRTQPVRVLDRRVVRTLLDYGSCLASIESVFRQQASGTTISAASLGTNAEAGSFHVKTAGLLKPAGDNSVFVAKINANFPANPLSNGLPTIQGVIALFDAEVGRPLAILDSIEITSIRTAAATAVAAKFLAREHAATVTICGCGEQGRSQLRALLCVRPIERVFAFDIEPASTDRYASEMSNDLGIEVIPVRDLDGLAREADIWVTGTPSRQWFVGREHVKPGAFVAAVGADNPQKQEIEPDLLAASTVVVDVLEQCATMGDLHHALTLGLMTKSDVYADLADVVSGRCPGRRTADEIIVFDSTGTALEDVAAAKLVYDRAVAAGVGLEIDLAACGA